MSRRGGRLGPSTRPIHVLAALPPRPTRLQDVPKQCSVPPSHRCTARPAARVPVRLVRVTQQMSPAPRVPSLCRAGLSRRSTARTPLNYLPGGMEDCNPSKLLDLRNCRQVELRMRRLLWPQSAQFDYSFANRAHSGGCKPPHPPGRIQSLPCPPPRSAIFLCPGVSTQGRGLSPHGGAAPLWGGTSLFRPGLAFLSRAGLGSSLPLPLFF